MYTWFNGKLSCDSSGNPVFSQHPIRSCVCAECRAARSPMDRERQLPGPDGDVE